MKLYVLRHGQTNYNLEGKFQGQVNILLNEKGIEQALNVEKIFKKIDIDLIISSPLSRAIETVKRISNLKKIDIIIDERIIERSFGKLEGKYSISDFEANTNKYNIESMNALKKRVYSFLEELIENYSSKKILIATHEAVAKVIESFFYGEENGNKLRLGNGEYKEYNV